MEELKAGGLSKKLMTAAIAAAVVLGAAGVANAVSAQDDATPTPSTAAAQDTSTDDDTVLEGDDDDAGEPADDEAGEADEVEGVEGVDDDHDDGGEGHESTEVLLEGTQATDVTAAALAAVPGGTIDRVETDDGDAAFEAHMTDADGNRVTAKFDESLNLLAVETDGGPGDGRGHGGGDHHTPLDDATAAQVTAAAEAAVPGGTVLEVEAEDDGYEAHVMGTDGVELEVYFDQNFAVIETVPAD